MDLNHRIALASGVIVAIAAILFAIGAQAPDTWRLVVEKQGESYIADYGLSLSDCSGVADVLENAEPFYRGADVIYCERESA